MNALSGPEVAMVDGGTRIIFRKTASDERKHNDGAPNGIEQRGAPIPTTPERVITRIGAAWYAAAIVLSGLVAVGVLSNPLETKASANETHSALSKRLDDHDAQIHLLTNRLDDMERTGQLSLQLQLQGRLADIARDSKGLPEGSGAAKALEDTRLQLQQQLDEVKRQLRKQ